MLSNQDKTKQCPPRQAPRELSDPPDLFLEEALVSPQTAERTSGHIDLGSPRYCATNPTHSQLNTSLSCFTYPATSRAIVAVLTFACLPGIRAVPKGMGVNLG